MRHPFFIGLLLFAPLFPLMAQNGAGKSIVEATVGFGNLYYGGRFYEHRCPPVMLSYEQSILTNAFHHNGFSLNAGLTAAYTGASTNTQYGKAELVSTVSEGILALRATGYYHIPLPELSRMDVYAVTLLGWSFTGSKNTWSGNPNDIALAKTLGGEKEKVSGPMLGLLAGAQYWFSDYYGACIEIGYAPAFLNIGGFVAW